MHPRLVPVMVAINRATPEIDFSIPVVATVFGAVVGLLAFALGVFWRITTPTSALPLPSSVRPMGEHR
jgi:hypothetical protein